MRSTQPKRTLRLGVGVVLAAVSGVLCVGVGPAAAAISSFPAAAYTSNTTIVIQASVARSTTQSILTLIDPSGASKQIAITTGKDVLGSYDAATLSYNLATTCEQVSTNACSGDHPARNGTWAVKVTGDAANADAKQFRVDIAPRIPAGVTAASTDTRQITVTWQVNTEPDLQQYDVVDGAGNQLRTVDAQSCAGATCSSTFGYASNASGARRFAVSATRTAPAQDSGMLTSPASSTQTATLGSPPAPSAAPSGSPTTGAGSTSGQGPGAGGTSGSSGAPTPGSTAGPGTSSGTTPGSTNGGGSSSGPGAPGAAGTSGAGGGAVALAARTAFAQSFSSFAPKIGLNKLPPLLLNEGPILAEGQLPDGTFKGTLGYKDQIVSEKVSTGGGSTSRDTGALTQALDSAGLARTLAVVLLLLATGLHLRRWAGASR